MALSFQVTYDCADPDALARFWAGVLGYHLEPPPDGYPDWIAFLRERGIPEEQWNSASAIVDPDGNGPRLYFQQVPEAKAAKNRVHLDINVGTGLPAEERRSRIDAEVERVIRLGASRVQTFEETWQYWVVMQDPEGNEFCLH